MRSHLAHLLVYSVLVSVFFATLTRRRRREQLRLGGLLIAVMVGGALLLAYAMYPFPAPR